MVTWNGAVLLNGFQNIQSKSDYRLLNPRLSSLCASPQAGDLPPPPPSLLRRQVTPLLHSSPSNSSPSPHPLSLPLLLLFRPTKPTRR